MKKRVWLFHLLNDFSGSPLVLKNTILALKDDADITVCTSEGNGFLSDIDKVDYQYVDYQWSPKKLVTLLRFFFVQVSLLILIIKYRRKIDIVYVNTLLPFGAALGGLICNKKVVYHMHEPQINPLILFKFLTFIAGKTSDEVLFVSDYLKSCFPKLTPRGSVLPNVLNNEFKDVVKTVDIEKKTSVLMLCSFKEYKGVYDFVELAKLNPNRKFELILNSSREFIEGFISEQLSVKNLQIHPSQKNVHPFYEKARVVLNLSHPETWIESFGMTALEAMAYGTPCIVPEKGGISEVVTSTSGFCISSMNKQSISQTINAFFDNHKLYKSYSAAAKKRSNEYSFDNYKRTISFIL